MCLITFAYRAHPRYSLILAGNRDEFYARPTRKAGFWDEEGHPGLLAGKDLEGGGTWLGVDEQGRWGALTNYRDLSNIKKGAPTRGTLVLNFLKQNIPAPQYLDNINPEAPRYNGFNLLLWDESGFYHYDNQRQQKTEIAPGVHGLSNAFLDTPWPKTNRAKQQLDEIIQQDEIEKEQLFKLLQNETAAPERELPNTGLSRDMEKAVSPIFIRTDDYGTRCSTLLLIDCDGNIDFTERRYKNGNKLDEEDSHYHFQAPVPEH